MALNGVAYPSQTGFSAPTSLVGQVGLFGAPAASPFSLRDPFATQQLNLLWYRLNRSLLDLRTAAADLARPDLWNAKTAVSSNAETVGATATGDAETVRYEIRVTALARAEKLGGAVSATTVTPLGISGTFAVNGREVAVETDDALGDLADKLNRSGAGVKAKVETTEGGYRLTLTAEATGQAGTMALADRTPGVLAQLGLLDAAGEKANVLEAAADAVFTVNGREQTTSSNEPVVSGVQLSLRRTTASPVTVSVAVEYDEEAVLEGVRKFVDHYNAALGELARMTRSGGRLNRTSAAAVQRDLVSALQGAGVENWDALRPVDVGLKMGPGGTLALDEEAFREKFAASREAVAEAFVSPTGAAERVRQVLAPLTSPVAGYAPSSGEAPAAAWLTSQALKGYVQPASAREAELNRQAAVLQSSLALLSKQGSSLFGNVQGLFSPLL